VYLLFLDDVCLLLPVPPAGLVLALHLGLLLVLLHLGPPTRRISLGLQGCPLLAGLLRLLPNLQAAKIYQPPPCSEVFPPDIPNQTDVRPSIYLEFLLLIRSFCEINDLLLRRCFII
jgi:hypothetical protein